MHSFIRLDSPCHKDNLNFISDTSKKKNTYLKQMMTCFVFFWKSVNYFCFEARDSSVRRSWGWTVPFTKCHRLGGLPTTEICSSQSRRLEVGSGAAPLPWSAAASWLCPQWRREGWGDSQGLFYKGADLIREDPVSWTNQLAKPTPHLQIPSVWGLGFSLWLET